MLNSLLFVLGGITALLYAATVLGQHLTQAVQGLPF
jgi:hypothetical protein